MLYTENLGIQRTRCQVQPLEGTGSDLETPKKDAWLPLLALAYHPSPWQPQLSAIGSTPHHPLGLPG